MTSTTTTAKRETPLTRYLADRQEKLSPGQIEQLQQHYADGDFFGFIEIALDKELEECTMDYMDAAAMARYCLDGARDYPLKEDDLGEYSAYTESVLKDIRAGKAIDSSDKSYFLPHKSAKSPLDTPARAFWDKIRHMEFFSGMTERFVREYANGNKICLIMHNKNNDPTFCYYKNDEAVVQEILRGCGMQIKTTISLETADKTVAEANSR